MQVELAYGDRGLTVDVPAERTRVVEPSFRPGVADTAGVLRAALRGPVGGRRLRGLVRRGQRVAIAVCDATRPQPREVMVRAVLEELEGIVDFDDVVVLVATGTHRPNNDAELRAMLGDEVVDLVRVVNHDARDGGALRYVGCYGNGVPVWLNREWVDADVRVTTGFVEPHFFAGFSGGPKLVAPGLAGVETVLTLHDAARIGHPMATWGVTVGNPVHDDVRAIAAATGVTFAFDVILNRDRQVVEAFAGELFGMHRMACAAARRVAMQPVPRRYEVVVTSNSGYPLDQNLYQAVKGMTAAAQVVVPGGVIVCVAECRDGFPDHGSYRELLTAGSSPRELLDEIAGRSRTVADQWQVQMQAKVQCAARVVVCSGYLGAEALRSVHLESTGDVAACVREALDGYGPAAAVCVLPEGPQTIPYVQPGAATQ